MPDSEAMSQNAVKTFHIETVQGLLEFQFNLTKRLTDKTVTNIEIARTTRLKSALVSQVLRKGNDVIGEIFSVSAVGTVSPGARFALTGTRAHIIQGKPFLRWIGRSGEIVFRRQVLHPGIKKGTPTKSGALSTVAVADRALFDAAESVLAKLEI